MAGMGARRGAPSIRAALIGFFKRICPDARRVTADADVRRLCDLNATSWRGLATDINALSALVNANVTLTARALAACRSIRDIEKRLAPRRARAKSPVRGRTGDPARAHKAAKKTAKKKVAKKKAVKRNGGGRRHLQPKPPAPRKRAAPKASAPELARPLEPKPSGRRAGRDFSGFGPPRRPLGFSLGEEVRLKASETTPRAPHPAAPIRAPRAPEPRYANAALYPEMGELRLPTRSALVPARVVRLRLDVGPLSRESQVENPERLPSIVQGMAELDVMVTSTDFLIGTDGRAVTDRRGGGVAHGRFLLPADGGPGATPDGARYLVFHLRAPEEKGIARCRIGYYFRNALMQSQQLVADIGGAGGYSIRTDFTLSESLADLEAVPRRPRLSVLTNDNGAGLHQIVVRRVDETNVPAGTTFTLHEQNVGDTVRALRKKLTDLAPGKKERSRRDLIADLTALAPLGWSLYTQVGNVLDEALAAWTESDAAPVIQVLRPTTSSFVLPWGLCYDIPLDSKTEWTTCPAVETWDERTPLVDVAKLPRACSHNHARGNVLCPFGFIGLRYAIEQLSRSDKPVLTIASAPRCDFAVAETQYQLPDPKALEKHVAALRSLGAGANPPVHLTEAKDRAAVQTLLGGDVSLVYFFCHGNRPHIGDPNTYLAVGNDEAITAPDFIGWLAGWRKALKRRIWDAVRPLVFINACHSLAVEPETLVSYLDAFVTWGHAAGVIGTEVKVAQPLAIDVAEQFYRRLLARTHTVETALHAIRIDYLANGNLFGLVYTPYCWADLRME
jgi:hypothetical protein